MENVVTIKCLDCGAYLSGAGQPKGLAKRNSWSHAGPGKWRCHVCSGVQRDVFLLSHAETKRE